MSDEKPQAPGRRRFLASAGRRIGDLTSLKTGKPLEAAKEYTVTGWASINEGTEGPAIWDVVMRHIEKKKTVAPREAGRVRVTGL